MDFKVKETNCGIQRPGEQQGERREHSKVLASRGCIYNLYYIIYIVYSRLSVSVARFARGSQGKILSTPELSLRVVKRCFSASFVNSPIGNTGFSENGNTSASSMAVTSHWPGPKRSNPPSPPLTSCVARLHSCLWRRPERKPSLCAQLSLSLNWKLCFFRFLLIWTWLAR